MPVSAREQWLRIAARIRALNGAASALWPAVRLKGSDYYGVTDSQILPSAKSIVSDVQHFWDAHRDLLEVPARDAVQDGVTRLHKIGRGSGSGIPLATALMVALLVLESEVSFHLQDFDICARPVVERAFLHLQRSLVVDSELRKRWLEAMCGPGETACEKLGAIHLLLHGIYAFKTDSKGERTDLVLGERLVPDNTLRRATTALVLTEWKVAHGDSEARAKFEQAAGQARLYTAGILAGFEVARSRYLVVVSKDRLALPDDPIENGVAYRHINVAIEPSVPSRARRCT